MPWPFPPSSVSRRIISAGRRSHYLRRIQITVPCASLTAGSKLPLRGLRAPVRAHGLSSRRRSLAEPGRWRDGWGRRIRIEIGGDIIGHARRTRVVLAAAHRDHDTSDNADGHLAAFCQRCHMIHDRPEHKRRRWRTLFRRKAWGTCSVGPTREQR